MKKKICSVLIACLMMLGGLSFVACGGNSKVAEQSYKELSSIMTKMKADTTVFTQKNVSGVDISYGFKAFEDSDYTYYDECLVIPMQYIERNVQDLENIIDKTDLSGSQRSSLESLNKSVVTLSGCYDQLKAQNENLIIFPTSGKIYKGALQQYQYVCTRFISAAYDVAFDLADIEINVFDRFEEMKTRALTQEDSVRVRNYVSMKIGKDYFNLLLDSSNSKLFDSAESDSNLTVFKTFVNGIKADLGNFIQSFYSVPAEKLTNLQSEPKIVDEKEVYNNVLIQEILDMHNDMDNERKILDKAFDKFSMYDFYQFYNCNLSAYENDVKYADIYYNQIQNYYNSYIQLQIFYYKNLIA